MTHFTGVSYGPSLEFGGHNGYQIGCCTGSVKQPVSAVSLGHVGFLALLTFQDSVAFIEFDGDEPFIGKCFLLVTTTALLLAYFFPLLVHSHSLSGSPCYSPAKKNLECVCVCVCVCMRVRGLCSCCFTGLTATTGADNSDTARQQFIVEMDQALYEVRLCTFGLSLANL